MQRYSSLLQQKIENTKGIQTQLLLIFQAYFQLLPAKEFYWSTVEMIPHEFCAWSLEAFKTKLFEHPFEQVIFILKSWTQIILGGFTQIILIFGFLMGTLGRAQMMTFSTQRHQSHRSELGGVLLFTGNSCVSHHPNGPIPHRASGNHVELCIPIHKIFISYYILLIHYYISPKHITIETYQIKNMAFGREILHILKRLTCHAPPMLPTQFINVE